MGSADGCQFQTLIPDILVQIFTLCLPDDPRPSAAHAPLALARVCSHWRTVALSYAPLWSTVHIGGQTDTRKPIEGRLHGVDDLWALRTFLRRSKNAPLSLKLVRPRIDGWNEHLNMQLWIYEIIAHSQRWKRLELYCSVPYLEPVYAAITGGVPLLEEISVSSPSDTQARSPFTLDLDKAPRLSIIRLLGWNDILPSEPLITFERIRALHLRFTGTLKVAQLLDWLAISPNLAECALLFGELEPFRKPDRGKIHLGSMTSFTLMENLLPDGGDLRGHLDAIKSNLTLIQHLDCPALKRLRIATANMDGDLPFAFGQQLASFIERSRPPLVSLTLGGCIDMDWAVEVFKMLPTLEDIKLIMAPGGHHVLESMTLPSPALDPDYAKGREIICPRLRSISILYCGERLYVATVNMIVSRVFPPELPSTGCTKFNTLVRYSIIHGEGRATIYDELLEDPKIQMCLQQGLRIGQVGTEGLW